mmetsp:Transcript_13266/g.19836  ORF Transcript_13266/g.19836 Transcript_13266/m.19836 type:complete len:250 (+) Transcript_13266:2271-3020(+)
MGSGDSERENALIRSKIPGEGERVRTFFFGFTGRGRKRGVVLGVSFRIVVPVLSNEAGLSFRIVVPVLLNEGEKSSFRQIPDLRGRIIGDALGDASGDAAERDLPMLLPSLRARESFQGFTCWAETPRRRLRMAAVRFPIRAPGDITIKPGARDISPGLSVFERVVDLADWGFVLFSCEPTRSFGNVSVPKRYILSEFLEDDGDRESPLFERRKSGFFFLFFFLIRFLGDVTDSIEMLGDVESIGTPRL